MHIQHSSDISAWNYISKWIQQPDYDTKPPLVSYLQLTISFAEVEVLLKKLMDVRVFGDAAG